MRTMPALTLTLTLTLALALPALAAAAPAAPELSDDDEATLAGGKMFVRTGIDGIPWKTMGVIDIDANKAKTWEAILDFDARLVEMKAAKAYDIYSDVTQGAEQIISASWDLKVLGTEIAYSLHYHYNETDSYLYYVLDQDKDNDLVTCDGSYQVIDSPVIEGGCRFFYVVDTDSGRKIPESLRVMLAKGGLKDMLEAIKKRAEG
jgi:hypothetical protein